jgi:hypothetical protein
VRERMWTAQGESCWSFPLRSIGRWDNAVGSLHRQVRDQVVGYVAVHAESLLLKFKEIFRGKATPGK